MSPTMTERDPAEPTDPPINHTGRKVIIGVVLLIGLVLTVIAVLSMETGVGSRIGVTPRPGYEVGGGYYANEPFLGFAHWPMFSQVYVFFEGLAIYGWYGWTSWRQRRVRPMLVLLIVATLIAPIADPLISWAAYTAYDPRLWHVPETWPLYNSLPTIQPLASLPGYAMFFVCSIIPGLWLHRYLLRRSGPESIFRRRQLLTVFLVVGSLAFVFDSIQAFIATRLEVIVYTQVATVGYRPGTTWQANALWEPILCFVMFGLTALAVYEDTDGKTLADKWRVLPGRPVLREFVVVIVFVTVATTIYISVFSIVRLSGAATNVACPWPYQNTQVYDPDGLYAATCPEAAGSAGG